ncbi:MAG: homoserine kinase [Clostridia bacterium]|nr:homoserine kinase [Clostridia bacterium]
MEQITVRVPATTANLAAGFDVLGCALTLYNTLSFRLQEGLSFSGCDAAYQNPENLAYQGFACVYDHIGQRVPGVHIGIEAEIPVSRGLGSSAALLAAGAYAANALSEAGLSTDTLIALTTRIEGHPDNLAPAFYGGLTASMLEDDQVFTVRYAPHPSLRFVALSPGFPLSTHAARSVLPAAVPFRDAVYNGAHLAVLLRALEKGDMPQISAALRDRLHQPYRIPLIDEYEDVRRIAAQNGCEAVCISGAGPTILCLTQDPGFAGAMETAVKALRHRWVVRDLTVDAQGAQGILCK